MPSLVLSAEQGFCAPAVGLTAPWCWYAGRVAAGLQRSLDGRAWGAVALTANVGKGLTVTGGGGQR
ncbi:MAG: hypothetical protein WBR33_02000, partial [Pseudonocardiaceae bacterium]